MSQDGASADERYWVVSEAVLHEMLLRAQRGESAGLLLIELQANSRIEEVD